MAEPISSLHAILALLNKLGRAVHESQRSDSALASPELKESRRKVEVVLETSRQKFQVWMKTWMENISDPAMSGEKLWGDEGWGGIQKLLVLVHDNARDIENELMKKDDKVSHLGWRGTLRSSLSRKNRRVIVQRRPLLDLAVQLSRSIDELWTYSEMAFDSQHGILSHQIGPPLREELLIRSLHARTGSLALYEACRQSKADYSLEVDLLGDSDETRSIFHRRNSTSSMKQPVLSYHFFAQNRNLAGNVSEITLKSVSARAVEQYYTNSKVAEFDVETSDLAVFKSWPSFDLETALISIHSPMAVPPSYFRVLKPLIELDWEAKTDSLAQLLYEDRVKSSQPLDQEARVQLAFKVVECGFYLLGTPWLASLSSKRLRRGNIGGATRFVLEVQTLDLEDLYFEDPDALSERSQLFSIGVILVEIALRDEMNHQDTQSMQDPDLRTSKILPRVERSMGSLYCAATAFCLADRSSLPHFDRPEKYRNPEGTGWTAYLTALLEDYYAQVFSR